MLRLTSEQVQVGRHGVASMSVGAMEPLQKQCETEEAWIEMSGDWCRNYWPIKLVPPG